jgi:hypothetical protein
MAAIWAVEPKIRLEVAEYLRALGSGSTGPVSPSGALPEATNDSAPPDCQTRCSAPRARRRPELNSVGNHQLAAM